MSDQLPSSLPGMGAIPNPTGATFRVWAPHAEQVYVSGSFNGWSKTATPLASEGNGYWSKDVAAAKAGDEYKYFMINDGMELWRIDPYAKDVTSSVGNAVIVDSDFDWGTEVFQMPPWNQLVIYEMHIGTFFDQPGGAPGNLDGVIAKLPHLKELGINAIQVMPPMEFAGGFSWGYNTAHLYALEEDYGGPKGFKQFIRSAHELGMAVIFDVVYNHLGPSDLGIWQFDGWSENDKGGIYFYNDSRSNTPWGDTRPDYGRGEVRQYLRDNALMWLEEYQIDGLRWDATAYIRNLYGNNNDPANNIPEGWSLMQWINNEINARQSWKINIAEDLRNNPWITQDTGSGGAGFDAQWSSGFVHPVREAIIAQNDHERDMYAVTHAITQRYSNNPFQRVIYTESHDEVANGKAWVPEEIWPGNAASWASKKRSTLGAVLVFTSPGIPMIFQGQELLEDEWFRDQDPIDWSKKVIYRGIFLMYRDLIRLRRNWYDHTRGLRGDLVHVHHINNNDKVIAFQRWVNGGPKDTVVVVVNMSHHRFDSYQIGFPREGLWNVRFDSDWFGYDNSFGDHLSYDTTAHWGEKDGMPCNGNVGIGPYSALILSQDN